MTRIRLLGLVVLGGLAAAPAYAASVTLCAEGQGCTIGAGNIAVASVGASFTLQVFVDTEGQTLEGYTYGVDLSGLGATGIVLTHQDLGLTPDFFGAASVDEGAGEIRNINQADFLVSVAAGVHLIDTLTFTVGSVPGVAAADLFDDSFGIGGGACPDTDPPCEITFFDLEIVPEPASGVLVAFGLGALALRRRR